MSSRIKFYLLFGTVIMDFVYAATSPIIQVHFVTLVGPNILAMANILSTGLAAIVNATIPVQRIKDWYRKHFLAIIVIDTICFALISFESVSVPEVRFLGFAVLNAVSSTLWWTIIKDAINHNIEGDELTSWDSIQRSVNLGAALIGSIVAVIFTAMPVEACILAQCIASAIMGMSDWQAYKFLRY